MRISDWSSDVCSSDLLALDSNNGKVALSLALAQTAEGDWTAARATLDDHAGVIPATDRGLALVLAGDTKAALPGLVPPARERGATATSSVEPRVGDRWGSTGSSRLRQYHYKSNDIN